LQLAAAGSEVIAVDRSKARLERLRENLDRTGLADGVQVVAKDVLKWAPDDPADAILLDAPCSALGTLRRHPEGAWIKTAQEIEGYPAVQEAFLRSALEWLKPGGRLVYCVCTPRQQEGREVIERVLADGHAQRAPIAAKECPGFESALTPAGDLLTIPKEERRCDAFFVSRLSKPR